MLNRSFASKPSIPELGLGSAPAFVPTDFGVMYKSRFVPPSPSSSLPTSSFLISGALCLLSSSTCSWSWSWVQRTEIPVYCTPPSSPGLQLVPLSWILPYLFLHVPLCRPRFVYSLPRGYLWVRNTFVHTRLLHELPFGLLFAQHPAQLHLQRSLALRSHR